MAVYLGNYEADSSRLFKCAVLTVGFVEVTTGEIRGQFSLSTEADDRRYLPDVWFANVELKDRRRPGCSLPHTPRYALLWITNTLYLRIPLPFPPGSSAYNQFFIATSVNTDLTTVGQRGEQVSSNWLKLYIK
jgi:hypothetical protein